MKQEIVEIIEQNTFFLATKGTCGNPRIRPMRSIVVDGDKLYFCTKKGKNLVKHIQNFSGVELCIFDNKRTWLRIRGEAKVIEKQDFSEKLQKIFKDSSADLVIFGLDKMSIKLQDLDGREEVYQYE